MNFLESLISIVGIPSTIIEQTGLVIALINVLWLIWALKGVNTSGLIKDIRIRAI